MYHCLFQSQLLCALWCLLCNRIAETAHGWLCVILHAHCAWEKVWFPPLPLAESCWETLTVMVPLRLENCPPLCIQAPPLPGLELCFLDIYIGVNAENRCLPECCQIWSGYWFSITANTAARILCSGLFYEFVPGGNSPLFLLSFLGWETKQCIGLAGSFLACHWYFVGSFHIAFGCLSNWNNLSLPELLLTLYLPAFAVTCFVLLCAREKRVYSVCVCVCVKWIWTYCSVGMRKSFRCGIFLSCINSYGCML